MLMSNCEEKMGVIISSSTTNEWPQIDDQNLMASTNMGSIDKPTQEQIQQALKCPRCDSSNTKFCYYNNYSLSQPRHFCKACKRYWTRGGTLRNVPVGGGCRKNKRVKRAVGGSTSVGVDSCSNNSVSSTAMATINPNSHHSQIDHGRGNPLFFHGLQHNNMNLSSELNLSFNSSADHVGNPLYEYDLQPQMSSLGFSSSGRISMTGSGDILSKSLLSNYHHLPNFGGSGSPTMASLLSSSNLQQKNLSHLNGGVGDNRVPSGSKFLGFSQYENHMQMQGSEIQQNIGSSDPNSPFWNGNGVGSWLDPANVGSSVPSLI